jgi:polar amino acid transport system permease protein
MTIYYHYLLSLFLCMNRSSQPSLAPALTQRLANVPWWLLVLILGGLFAVLQILTNERSTTIFTAISRGVVVTLRTTIIAYVAALVIGLTIGLARTSSNKLIYNLASFYVEVVRGIPMLVLLLYIAFVAVPLAMEGLNRLGEATGSAWLSSLTPRNFPNEWRVVLGLGIAYGAFESENFRAGIQSIERGQFEASRALGMSYWQTMRFVVLPQAIRRIMPTLGNDFISMLKDSSLVSVLGVEDITQITKLYASSTFLFFQSYSILAFMYLTMTVLLSRAVRWMELRLASGRR